MKLGLNPILEVEAVIYEGNGILPLSGQVFYILEKSPDGLLKANDLTSELGYGKTMNALRNHALTFFVTNSQGKAEVEKLKTEIYYICGIFYTQKGVLIWNVSIELKSGQKQVGTG